LSNFYCHPGKAGGSPNGLEEFFAKAYGRDAILRGMMCDLKSLDAVRIIEDVSEPAGAEKPEEEE